MQEKKQIITPAQIIDIAWRRRWLIIIPFLLSTIAGSYLAVTLPRIYQASTLILVQPQRVPTEYVRTIVTQDINARISTIRQQIMSRSNLEKIIEQFNLFSEPEQTNMFLEDKLESLRERISVDITRARQGADAFAINFIGKDPEKVMRIANSLGTYFIDENLKVREAQAIGTSDFLDEELNSMRLKLEEVEETLKQFRKVHMGELPEQLQTNLTVLNRLQTQLSDRRQNLRDAKARLISIENQLMVARIQVETTGRVESPGSPTVAPPSELEQLRTQLEDLKTRYTDRHPDVLRLEKLIEQKEAEEEKSAPASDQGEQGVQTDEPINPVIMEYERQLVELQNEIRTQELEIAEIESQIQFYQKRVENTPKREQEILSLRRDYENIQTTYNSLLSRKLESEIAVNMEKKQKGEQFRIVDSARLPEKPIRPDLRKLLVLVIGAGLGLGGGIIFLLEYMDTSFRKPEEIEGELGLPVLCTVPRLINPRQKRMQRLNLALTAFTVAISFTTFSIFVVLTLKGVDRTLAFVKRFVDF